MAGEERNKYTRTQVEEVIKKVFGEAGSPTPAVELFQILDSHEGDNFTPQELESMFGSIAYRYMQGVLVESTYTIGGERDQKRLADQVWLRANGKHGETLRRMIREAINNLDPQEMANILDGGAGGGDETTLIAELFLGRASVVGVEKRADSIDKAKKLAKDSEANSSISFLQKDLLREFNTDGKYNNSFDIANVSAVAMWTKKEDMPLLLTQIWNCLKPGGEALFSDAYQFREGRITGKTKDGVNGPTIENLITIGLTLAPNVDVVDGIPGELEDFLTILKNFGFEVIEVVEEHYAVGGQSGELGSPVGGGLKVAKEYAETIANAVMAKDPVDLQKTLQKIGEETEVLSKLPSGKGGKLSYKNFRVRRPLGSELKKVL